MPPKKSAVKGAQNVPPSPSTQKTQAIPKTPTIKKIRRSARLATSESDSKFEDFSLPQSDDIEVIDINEVDANKKIMVGNIEQENRRITVEEICEQKKEYGSEKSRFVDFLLIIHNFSLIIFWSSFSLNMFGIVENVWMGKTPLNLLIHILGIMEGIIWKKRRGESGASTSSDLEIYTFRALIRLLIDDYLIRTDEPIKNVLMILYMIWCVDVLIGSFYRILVLIDLGNWILNVIRMKVHNFLCILEAAPSFILTYHAATYYFYSSASHHQFSAILSIILMFVFFPFYGSKGSRV